MSEGVTTLISGSSRGVRNDALEALRASVNADCAVWVDLTKAGTLACVQSVADERPARALAPFLGRPLPSGAVTWENDALRQLRRGGWTLAQPRREARAQFLRFEDEYRSVESLRALPIFRDFYAPAGVSDKLRLLAYRGTQLLGWVAALAIGSEFSRHDQVRANSLTDSTIEAFAAARTLEALDDDAFLIFDGAGVVERGTERALAWLSRERAEIFARCVCAADRDEGKQFRVDGVSARLVRLAGGESVRYLAMLKDRDSIELRVGAGLSPMEQAVAEDLAAGLTIPEIAASRGRAESTVKTQAKNIYRELGVASRVELVEALRGEVP